jgi:hypothetical protein
MLDPRTQLLAQISPSILQNFVFFEVMKLRLQVRNLVVFNCAK